MKIVAIIPARMGSSRFPGKPLTPILGKSMIEHIYRRVSLCEQLHATVIATCDEEIRQAAENFGAPVVMTSSAHERASDRVAEAAQKLEADLIVMVQGDEPMIYPDMIDAAVEPFLNDDSVGCVNLTRRLDSQDDYENPNTIKVVTDNKSNAMYMTRAPVPTLTKDGLADTIALKQVCVIVFTRTQSRSTSIRRRRCKRPTTWARFRRPSSRSPAARTKPARATCCTSPRGLAARKARCRTCR